MLTKGRLINVQSRWHALVQVLQQSFFLPFGVKSLATTATSHGITQKFLLMGTFSDQVGTLQHQRFPLHAIPWIPELQAAHL